MNIFLAFLLITLGAEFMGFRIINVNFPINYEVYLSEIFEKMVEIYKYTKDKSSPLIIKISYNLLYYFSVCQIQVNKIKIMLEPYEKKFMDYLKANNIIVEIKTQILNIIDKNGNIITKLVISDKTHTLNLFEQILVSDSVSGAELSDKNIETGCVNKIYIERAAITKDTKLDYKVSKINFMMVELEHKNEKYILELKNDEHNYYIVNNCLNQNFFKYFLKNVLKVEINENNFDYKVTIIDHNVNFITLLPEQFIIINENDYSIYPVLNTTVNSNTQSITNTCIKQEENIIEELSTNSDSDKSDDFVKLDANN